MTTITANSTVGLYLTSPAYSNPVVIAAGVSVYNSAVAVSATGSTWTIENYGTLTGSMTYGSGIAFQSVTGSITNAVGATISANIGILASGDPLSIVNDGFIQGHRKVGWGIYLQAGGSITNQSGGTITAAVGIADSGAALTLVNAGGITGSTPGDVAAYLFAGGTVTNQSGGSLLGSYGIEGGYNAPVTVLNAGTITGQADSSDGKPGVGILLHAGGYISNAAAGTITAAYRAVDLPNVAATVVNAGGITASSPGGEGVYFYAGGTVTDQSGGVILGSYGIEGGTGGAVSVLNAGSITGQPDVSNGNPGFGVLLKAGGYLSNAATGTITGAYRGVDITGAAGTVVNAGSITGHATNGAGVYLGSGGGITNQSGGTISGRGAGAVAGGSGGAITVVNAGLLTSSTYDGINAAGGASIGNSGSIYGALGGVRIAGAAGTLSNIGTISSGGTGAGVALLDGGPLTNQAGGDIQSTGGNAIYATGAYGDVLNAGVVTAGTAGDGIDLRSGGYVSIGAGGSVASSAADGVYITGGAGTVFDAGTITGDTASSTYAVALPAGFADVLAITPGAVFNGRITGGNSIGAAAVSTLELAPGPTAGLVTGLGSQVVNFGSIVFEAGADWSISGSIAGLSGTISGFALGDTIEVAGITATGSSYAAGVLTLDEASGSVQLNLPGDFTTSDFVVSNGPHGAKVSLECFRVGTRLRTPRGEVAVEDLVIGEPVQTGFSGAAPVTWIGRRHIDCRTHPRPETVWPVRVSAGAFGVGAFGDNQPGRDLWLSPGHAVFVDDVLIPIGRLVNGRTIVQEPVDTVIYYHVELPRHDLLVSEGLLTESYLDAGDRANFENGGAVRLFPDFSVPTLDAATRWEVYGCAPLIVTGPLLDAARDRLRPRSDSRAVGRRASIR